MLTTIQNKKEYETALDRVEELSMDLPDVNSEEGRELMHLGNLIDQYEEKEFPLN